MKVLDAAQEKYLTHMEARIASSGDASKKYPDFPLCFETSKQFHAWMEVEAIAHTKPRALPCRDCTVEFHNAMSAAGRCAVAGIPRVTRIMDKT